MPITLTDGQNRAVEMVQKFTQDEQATFAVLTGFAGSGKTTCVRHIAKTQLISPIVLAPTGKAALRVTEATDLKGITVHKFLYNPSENPKTGEPVFALKSVNELGDLRNTLVIIDEASMVSEEIWKDLLTANHLSGCKFLLIGDTFQLPPVQKETAVPFAALELNTNYRVHLNEIVRQAQESPIIRATMLIRQGAPEWMAMDLLNVVSPKKFIDKAREMHETGGAVIVHTNKTRNRLNNEIRESYGYEPDTLMPKEPLLVIRNNYQLDRYNGEIVEFNEWKCRPNGTETVTDRYTNSHLLMQFGVGMVDGMEATLAIEQVTGRALEEKISMPAIKHTARQMCKTQLFLDKPLPHLDVNYGYSLTGNKAQGSEWPEVLVVLESSLDSMKPVERRRWLYTSFSRAQNEVFVIYP